ncbi:MAG: acyl-CoA dehydrogenase family protein [Rhodobacteraceae bacterium]|nr:acyl-CoA dehydrogenase family protein [Paracoccaceae bacterium]
MTPTPRRIYSQEHEQFREQVVKFIARDVAPYHADWERTGCVSRAVWERAGEIGLLCPTVAESDGGPELDILFSFVVIEEMARAGANGPGFFVHSEMVAPYLSNYGSAEQRRRWLPGMVAGTCIGAVAMSEPGAGSDLRGMRTRARKDGDDWVLDGQKVFISNGQLADLMVVAAKTEGDRISLFLVDTSLPGFRRGQLLDKIGNKAQDTSEIFFDDMRLPGDALLGTQGEGFAMLMGGLVRERVAIAVGAAAKAEHAYQVTVDYVKNRQVFGKTLLDYQNTRFQLASVYTEIAVARGYVDQLVERLLRGDLTPVDSAVAKLWTTEMLGRAVDTCLQLHGGWGYMNEYPIARAYADARVERIVGGTSEVMREIIGRSI